MSEVFIRRILYYRSYYLDFFQKLDPKAKKKFNWTLKLIATVDRIPSKYFKYIENSNGIYKIRVEYESNIYRVFSFFDKGQIVILVNGFQKKSRNDTKERN